MSSKIAFAVVMGLLVSSAARAAEWNNISDSRKLDAATRDLQNAGHKLSASLSADNVSIMVQVYEQVKPASVNAEELLNSVYTDSMAPLLIGTNSLSAGDVAASSEQVIKGLPGASPAASKAFQNKFAEAFEGASARFRYQFSAEAGACQGFLLVAADGRKVVEIATCETK